MNKMLGFGAIVRVDPITNPKVKQPDPRRWMVLVRAETYARHPWTLMYVGPARKTPGGDEPISISHWPSLTGFSVVEEE